MTYPRTKGSTKWRGMVKSLVREHVDNYNRLFAVLNLEYRMRVTQKPRLRGQKKES